MRKTLGLLFLFACGSTSPGDFIPEEGTYSYNASAQDGSTALSWAGNLHIMEPTASQFGFAFQVPNISGSGTATYHPDFGWNVVASASGNRELFHKITRDGGSYRCTLEVINELTAVVYPGSCSISRQ